MWVQAFTHGQSGMEVRWRVVSRLAPHRGRTQADFCDYAESGGGPCRALTAVHALPPSHPTWICTHEFFWMQEPWHGQSVQA